MKILAGGFIISVLLFGHLHAAFNEDFQGPIPLSSGVGALTEDDFEIKQEQMREIGQSAIEERYKRVRTFLIAGIACASFCVSACLNCQKEETCNVERICLSTGPILLITAIGLPVLTVIAVSTAEFINSHASIFQHNDDL